MISSPENIEGDSIGTNSIESLFQDIKSGISLMESKLNEKVSLLIQIQNYNTSLQANIKSLQGSSPFSQPNSDPYFPSRPAQDPNTLSKEISKTTQIINSTNKVTSNTISKSAELSASIDQLSSTLLQTQQKISNLQEIKESLLSKLQLCDQTMSNVESKITHHQEEEKKIATELFQSKSQVEQALISFQFFKFKLVSLFKQESSIQISQSSGLKIFLTVGKTHQAITKDIHCTAALSQTRGDRFFLTINKTVKEFESPDSGKIVKFLNMALKLLSE